MRPAIRLLLLIAGLALVLLLAARRLAPATAFAAVVTEYWLYAAVSSSSPR